MSNGKVRQLTGPGIKGLEHCPPTYHFDFSLEEFQSFILNPAEAVKELGLDFKVTNIELAQWDKWYSQDGGWKKRPKAAKARPARAVCCHGGADGGVRCHMHR